MESISISKQIPYILTIQKSGSDASLRSKKRMCPGKRRRMVTLIMPMLFFVNVHLQSFITGLKPHIITLVCSNQALSHYTSFFSFCSASAFSFFTPACTGANAEIHYRGECMQHVERSKCVFISSRLIYSPLAWRWERRTTIYNELDVSDHTVFAVQSFLLLHWDCFCYFFGLYVCVFVHPVSSKSLCGAVLG